MNKITSDRDGALSILKEEGALSIIELSKRLKITVEGARFQLTKLAGEGLVKSTSVSKGRGRPQQIWSLTSDGHGCFPDAHAELTMKMIEAIRETLGEDALNSVINTHGKKVESRYEMELKDQNQLEEKVKRLVELRTLDGYMAEYHKTDNGFVLIENHCPICTAAEACPAFCQSELQTFKRVLGKGVSIKRKEHILSGGRRCAYSIIPLNN